MSTTTQQEQTEEYQDLEKIEEIDERVLNTPAEEQKVTLPTIDDGQKVDTFMQFNKTPQVTTDEGIVLDLAGQQAEIEEGELTTQADSKLLRKITGQELTGDEATNPGAFLIIIMVSIVLFGFLVMNMKRTEEIGKLKEEIDKMKKFSLSDR